MLKFIEIGNKAFILQNGHTLNIAYFSIQGLVNELEKYQQEIATKTKKNILIADYRSNPDFTQSVVVSTVRGEDGWIFIDKLNCTEHDVAFELTQILLTVEGDPNMTTSNLDHQHVLDLFKSLFRDVVIDKMLIDRGFIQNPAINNARLEDAVRIMKAEGVINQARKGHYIVKRGINYYGHCIENHSDNKNLPAFKEYISILNAKCPESIRFAEWLEREVESSNIFDRSVRIDLTKRLWETVKEILVTGQFK